MINSRNRRMQMMLMAGFCLLIWNPGLFAQKQDLIYRSDGGKTISVDSVISETYKEVKYKKSNAERVISADKVDHVQYHDVPTAYRNGLSFLNKGEYENALNSFKLAMEDADVRSWIKTYALLEIGKIYQLWGLSAPDKFGESIKTFNELLQLDPETRFYGEVLFNLAQSHSKNGDLSSALATFDRLSQEAYDKKLGVIWEARAKLGRAQAQLEAGSLSDAERDFRSAGTFAAEQSKSAEDPILKQELEKIIGHTSLSQGLVMIRKKDYIKASRFFENIVKDPNKSIEVIAGAECGIGECLLAEKKLKEAQVQFARAKVLYGDVSDAGAHATYFLGTICLEMKDSEPNYKKRAREYFQEVLDWYPDTEWAKKAKAKID